MAKKYDIRVCDTDINGGQKWHEESGIMANSVSELKNIYSACGQQIQIVREYDDAESQNYGKQNYIDPANVVLNTTNGGTGYMNVSAEEQNKINEFLKRSQNKTNTPEGPGCDQAVVQRIEQKTKEPTKYFQVGGIKCKFENGKMYQKQWVKLSESESSEFRVISDKNNKICPLSGKHIEIMKWVIVENEGEELNSKFNEKQLDIING